MADDTIGGELFGLWKAAEVHLPRVAAVFYDANRMIAGMARPEGDAFADDGSASDDSPVPSSSPSQAAWVELRDEMQRTYAQVGSTILEAAQGVRMALKAYTDTDKRVSDAFRAYRADPRNHNQKDPDLNPPAPGDADAPGQPILPD